MIVCVCVCLQIQMHPMVVESFYYLVKVLQSFFVFQSLIHVELIF